MSRKRQILVATGTFSVALGIGFAMQNGDALAARFGDSPDRTLTQAATAAVVPAVSVQMATPAAPEAPSRDVVLAAAGPAAAATAMPDLPAPADLLPAVPVALVPAPQIDLSLPAGGGFMNQALLSVGEGVTGLGAMLAPRAPEAAVVPAALLQPEEIVPDTAPAIVDPSCDVTMAATALPAAMVALSVSAPCAPDQAAVIHHQGMMFTVLTDGSGAARLTVPALAESAVFLADLPGGEGAVAVVTVPDMAQYDRAVLQWQGASGPQLHAREFGAAYGDAGHVWQAAPRDHGAALAGGGFLSRLGDAAAPDAYMAEVYTFPSGESAMSGRIDLTVEAEVTEATCGQELAAQTIQVTPGGLAPLSLDLAMVMPECSILGDFVVLDAMFFDLTVAAATP